MLLLDNSAWARLNSSALPAPREDAIARSFRESEIAICLPFLLEAGYSARSARGHRSMLDGLFSLPRVEVSPAAEQRALDAQASLAAGGHHQIPPVDVMIAACAHEARAGVLHYDADYDLLAEMSGLEFESVWLAPAGGL